MSFVVRALWVVQCIASKKQAPSDDGGVIVPSAVLFSRRFPTVERRQSQFNVKHRHLLSPPSPTSGGAYVTPSGSQLFSLIKAAALSPNNKTSTVVLKPSHDTCCYVVYLHRDNKLYCAVPYMDKPLPKDNANAMCDTVVVGALACLHNLADAALRFNAETLSEELQVYVSAAIPFGVPDDMHSERVVKMTEAVFPAGTVAHKRPAWKPVLYHGRQTLILEHEEQIVATQFDKPDVTPDLCVVDGTLRCMAELEGLPEVSVSITSPGAVTPQTPLRHSDQQQEQHRGDLPHLRVHTCVHSTTDTFTKNNKATKLCFSPPVSRFDLCRYRLTSGLRLPIRGYYQMKELSATRVKFLVQLKLQEDVNNSFEYCDVWIPFFHRGKITGFDSTPSAGTVAVKENKLVWSIGQKFTARNLEVAIPATVDFEHASLCNGKDDPYHFGENCFVEIHFCIRNHTLGGVRVDEDCVSIYPKTKASVLVRRRLVATEYRIWNSMGTPKVALAPKGDQ